MHLYVQAHTKSNLLFHIHSCKSWKHQFIITRQTLLEPVRLCLAVELDFPAGMDEHWVAQCILERMFCRCFPTRCVSRSPLCSLRGISCRAGKSGITALLSGKAAAQRKRKAVPQKESQWNRAVGPTSPRGLKAAFPICSFLVCSFTRTWEITKPYTQQWICRTIFFHLPSSSVCLRLIMDKATAWILHGFSFSLHSLSKSSAQTRDGFYVLPRTSRIWTTEHTGKENKLA